MGPATEPPRDLPSFPALADLVATEDPQAREAVAVHTPYTGAAIGEVPACTETDVTAAVDRAHTAQRTWAERPLAERADVVARIGEVVAANRERLMDLVQHESGKARLDAQEEVLDVVGNADHHAERAADYLAPERRRGALPLATRTVVHRDPVGVVGQIVPWNYPLTLVISDAIPALLAGNAVVLNPASQTPFTALYARRLLTAAGVPSDCIQVVTGPGPVTGQALVEAADYVSFTGSLGAGSAVATTATETLTDHSLELGGKNPFVVLADADLETAAIGALHACFATAGQLCISTERVLVHESRFEAFLSRFVELTADLTLGMTYDYGPEVGSLAGPEQLQTVRRHVADARDHGATVHAGGAHRPDIGPFAVEPTVLADVTDEMTVAHEETFGPVVSVAPVADADEAVARANDTTYGLHASVWTDTPERGRAVARDLAVGSVAVNDAYVASWGSYGAPMGGWNDSGYGRRHGPEGIHKYTRSQTVATQRGAPLVRPAWLSSTRLGQLLDRMVPLRQWLPGWPP
jgi:succinate-semialdehyde dehydrogenase/glutarate-semialdehyde dehydrogenase